MAAGKHVHRIRMTVAELMNEGAPVADKAVARVDNRPTPEQVAAMARAAITAEQVDHASDILTACESGWTKDELARFWALMAD